MRSDKPVARTADGSPFGTFKVRTVTIDGEPWFIAKDVCKSIGLGTPHMAYKRLGPGELAYRNQVAVGLPGGRDVATVNESGLYKLILDSKKPTAQPFQDWVTREVLPAIHKDGAYVDGEEKVRTGEMTEDERQ